MTTDLRRMSICMGGVEHLLTIEQATDLLVALTEALRYAQNAESYPPIANEVVRKNCNETGADGMDS
jgi:hypothetical protein